MNYWHLDAPTARKHGHPACAMSARVAAFQMEAAQCLAAAAAPFSMEAVLFCVAATRPAAAFSDGVWGWFSSDLSQYVDIHTGQELPNELEPPEEPQPDVQVHRSTYRVAMQTVAGVPTTIYLLVNVPRAVRHFQTTGSFPGLAGFYALLLRNRFPVEDVYSTADARSAFAAAHDSGSPASYELLRRELEPLQCKFHGYTTLIPGALFYRKQDGDNIIEVVSPSSWRYQLANENARWAEVRGGIVRGPKGSGKFALLVRHLCAEQQQRKRRLGRLEAGTLIVVHADALPRRKAQLQALLPSSMRLLVVENEAQALHTTAAQVTGADVTLLSQSLLFRFSFWERLLQGTNIHKTKLAVRVLAATTAASKPRGRRRRYAAVRGRVAAARQTAKQQLLRWAARYLDPTKYSPHRDSGPFDQQLEMQDAAEQVAKLPTCWDKFFKSPRWPFFKWHRVVEVDECVWWAHGAERSPFCITTVYQQLHTDIAWLTASSNEGPSGECEWARMALGAQKVKSTTEAELLCLAGQCSVTPAPVWVPPPPPPPPEPVDVFEALEGMLRLPTKAAVELHLYLYKELQAMLAEVDQVLYAAAAGDEAAVAAAANASPHRSIEWAQCPVCWDLQCSVCMPCGHGLCEPCAARLLAAAEEHLTCPLCRRQATLLLQDGSTNATAAASAMRAGGGGGHTVQSWLAVPKLLKLEPGGGERAVVWLVYETFHVPEDASVEYVKLRQGKEHTLEVAASPIIIGVCEVSMLFCGATFPYWADTGRPVVVFCGFLCLTTELWAAIHAAFGAGVNVRSGVGRTTMDVSAPL